MADPPRYTDWQITKRHAEIVQDVLPIRSRKVLTARSIAGVSRGRIGSGFRAGNYLMPLKSESVTFFSDTHDIARKSLLVLSEGTSSSQQRADEEPAINTIAERLRPKFAYRRVAMMNGELYSFIDNDVEYNVDDDMARNLDVIVLVLVSLFREVR